MKQSDVESIFRSRGGILRQSPEGYNKRLDFLRGDRRGHLEPIFLLPSFAGVVIGVFVPTITAVVLIAVTGGKSQVRARLFSAKAWHLSLKWLLISLGLGLTLRLGVTLLGLLVVPDYQWQPGPFSPLLLAPFLFAAGEQIGWRGFALPTTLTNGYRPLAAALILGLPWALLQPAIASFARVVAYDRPGLGWSESPPDGQHPSRSILTASS